MRRSMAVPPSHPMARQVSEFTPRPGTWADEGGIPGLYRAVAMQPGGIARSYDETDGEYIHGLLSLGLSSGIILVVDHPQKNNALVGEIHAHRGRLQVFTHVLGELTVAVHPEFQGRGIGRGLFRVLLDEVQSAHPEILRVELFARESNARAIALYESLGFVKEGRFGQRVATNGTYIADIPMAWFNPAFRRATGPVSPPPPTAL